MLLTNGVCVTLSPPMLEHADVRVSGGVILERGPHLEPQTGERVEDLGGKILMPGLVCAHTHLYSSLARGMPGPDRPPGDFLEILQRIWWRLDRALDGETIYYSALAGALEAARCGVTTVVDHHASPNAISGSLLRVKKGLDDVGLRGVLCYETSDRDGIDRRDEGLQENDRFLKEHASDEMFRGMVGGHASFTLSDESLRRMGEIAGRHDTGVHMHLAEAEADVRITAREYGGRIVTRLEEAGILRQKSLLAHCIHLTPEDFQSLRASGAWLVHNPRSNMNNRVGHAPLGEFGERKALGSDGFAPDMFEELRAAFFRDREASGGSGWEPASLLNNGQKLIAEVFGRPFGLLQEGAPADLIVVDYVPPTPCTLQNLPSHVLAFRSSMVESVMVNGDWVLYRREFPKLQEEELLRGAQAAARKLWSAMHDLTP